MLANERRLTEQAEDDWLKGNDEEKKQATSHLDPPVALSQQEEQMAKKLCKAKLFGFLQKVGLAHPLDRILILIHI